MQAAAAPSRTQRRTALQEMGNCGINLLRAQASAFAEQRTDTFTRRHVHAKQSSPFEEFLNCCGRTAAGVSAAGAGDVDRIGRQLHRADNGQCRRLFCFSPERVNGRQQEGKRWPRIVGTGCGSGDGSFSVRFDCGHHRRHACGHGAVVSPMTAATGWQARVFGAGQN